MRNFAPSNKKKQITIKNKNDMGINLNIELYKEGKKKCAYIGDDCGGSGIKVTGKTSLELAQNIVSYIEDYADNFIS